MIVGVVGMVGWVGGGDVSTKAFFPCGGGSNLILGTGTENHIFILRTPAAIKFFIKISKRDTLL